MKSIAFLFIFISIANSAVYNVQKWFLPLRTGSHHLLRPTERSQPLTVGGKIYFGSENGNFYAIRKSDARILWKVPFKHGAAGSPAFVDNKLYFGANDGNFYCLRASDGKVLWKYFVRYPSISKPTVVKGRIFVTAGDNAIYALDALTGKWLWQYKRNFPKALAIRGQCPPAYHKNALYVGFSDGFFVKLNSIDGALLWEKRLNDYHRFVDIDAAAYVDDKQVIVSAYDGNLYSLEPSTGKIQWKFKKGGACGILVKDSQVYLPTESGWLYVVSKSTGKEIWSFKAERGVLTTPIISNGLIYFGTSTSRIYALNIKQRKKIWEFNTASGLSTSPLIEADGSVLFLSNWGHFYAIKPYGLKAL